MGYSHVLTTLRKTVLLPAIVGTAGMAVPTALHAQQATAAVAAAVAGPAVGEAAPDFALSGATRYGLLRNPVRLSDYRGRTVVLAFFYQARTKG